LKTESKDSLLETIHFPNNWKLKQISGKLPKANYNGKHNESCDNILYTKDQRSISLTRNNETMVSHSTMQSSRLIDKSLNSK